MTLMERWVKHGNEGSRPTAEAWHAFSTSAGLTLGCAAG